MALEQCFHLPRITTFNGLHCIFELQTNYICLIFSDQTVQRPMEGVQIGSYHSSLMKGSKVPSNHLQQFGSVT